MDDLVFTKIEKVDLYTFNQDTKQYEYVTTLDEIQCVSDDELNKCWEEK